MTEKERLLKKLFESDGISHLNIKFFRGTSDSISPEELCQEANSAIFQMENGFAEVSEQFGDKEDKTIDVCNIVGLQ